MPEKERWRKSDEECATGTECVMFIPPPSYDFKLVVHVPVPFAEEIISNREAAEILEEIYRAWLDSEARSGYNHVEITPGDDIGILLRQWGERRKGR